MIEGFDLIILCSNVQINIIAGTLIFYIRENVNYKSLKKNKISNVHDSWIFSGYPDGSEVTEKIRYLMLQHYILYYVRKILNNF